MLCQSSGMLLRLTHLIPGIKSVQKFFYIRIPLVRYVILFLS